MPNPIRIVSLDCWHSNEIIYQADGRTDDGLWVYVRYRRPWFSVGIGPDPDAATDTDTFVTDAYPDHDPGTIDLATLRAWTEGVFEWPDRIDGYANGPDPEGGADSGEIHLVQGDL